MAHTHDFEIVADGKEINGEITFNHGTVETIKYDQIPEMTVKQAKILQKRFEFECYFNCEFGAIEKDEFTKKVI